MTHREKVIDDLNLAKLILCKPQMLAPEMCIRVGQAITSAINLLKEQEPRVLTWEELIDVTNPVWYEERDGISSWALCTDVTRGNAYEDMSYEFFENYDNSYIREYADKCNVYWRCWTARPTDEQRKAVKWE